MASPGTPSVKRFKSDYVDTINVLVGNAEFKFTIHEDVLVRSSKFFRSACSGEFKEAKDKTIRLPDLEVDTFRTYVHWAYVGEISSSIVDTGEQWYDVEQRMREATKLYVAGDMLDDQHLRNAAMDYLVEMTNATNYFPGVKIVAEVWENTACTSLLRKALVHQYLMLGSTNAEYFQKNHLHLPREFLSDVVYTRMILDNKKPASWVGGTACRYHEHNEEVPKCGK